MSEPIHLSRAARRIALTFLAGIPLGLAACDDRLETVAPQTPEGPSLTAAAVVGLPRAIRAEERAFADVAEDAKSSAGFYYDTEGRLVVLVRDPADHARARGAVGRLNAAGKLGFMRQGDATGPEVRIVKADYTFAQLAHWRDAAFDNVLGSVAGVTSLDLDEARNRVALGIDPSGFEATRAAAFEQLRRLGVDSAAIVFDTVGPARNDQTTSIPPDLSYTPVADPLGGGLRMDFTTELGNTIGGCTLGFAAQRNGAVGFVTNSHCTEQFMNPDKTRAFVGSIHVATEESDPSAYTCGVRRCRASDASFFIGITNQKTFGVGLIYRTTPEPPCGGLSCGAQPTDVDQSRPFFFVTAEENNDVYVGQEVHKVGITTGWTKGSIKQTCVDHDSYSGPGYQTVTRCTYEATYAAGEGDSGAPVFSIIDPNASTVKLLGIHQARAKLGENQARFSKLNRIKSDLGGTWVVTRPISLSTPVMSKSVSGDVPTVYWTASAGATKYHLYREYSQEVLIEDPYDPRSNYYETQYHTTYLGTITGTSFTDSYSSATTTPNLSYWVRAASVTDLSPLSARVYFP